MKNTGVIVIETSGLDPANSDILQVVITGRPGYTGFFAPDKCKTWPTSINKLTPEALEAFPVFGEKDGEEISQVLAQYDELLCYNEDFIFDFLTRNHVALLPGLLKDVMKEYAQKFHNDTYEKRIAALTDYGIISPESGAFSKAVSIKNLHDKIVKPKKNTERADR